MIMKLLIVEDDIRLRDRIAEGIDWESHGIELVGAAGNGEEGLRLVEKIGADIVLTDIRMPVMSGLELAGQLNRLYRQVKVIVLSGHDEFQYARDSIEFGVYRYLLKPASNDQILEATLGAAAAITKELEEKHSHSLLLNNWTTQLPRLQELFYRNWMTNRYASWEIAKRAEEVAIKLADTQVYVPVVLDIDPLFEDDSRFLRTDRSLLHFSLYSITKEALAGAGAFVLQDDNGMTVVLFIGSGEEERMDFYQKVNNLATDVLNTFCSCMKVTASAGIGPIVHPQEQLPDAYQKARQALQERMVHGHNLAVAYREEAHTTDRWTSLADIEKQLETAFDMGNEEQATEVALQMIGAAFSTERVSGVREFVIHAGGMLSRFVHSRQWLLSEVAGDDYTYFENLSQLLTRDQIQEWLVRMVGRIIRFVNDGRRSSTKQSIVEIVKFVEAKLHEEISLYKISESLYMNSSYLSRLFQRRDGHALLGLSAGAENGAGKSTAGAGLQGI